MSRDQSKRTRKRRNQPVKAVRRSIYSIKQNKTKQKKNPFRRVMICVSLWLVDLHCGYDEKEWTKSHFFFLRIFPFATRQTLDRFARSITSLLQTRSLSLCVSACLLFAFVSTHVAAPVSFFDVTDVSFSLCGLSLMPNLTNMCV